MAAVEEEEDLSPILAHILKPGSFLIEETTTEGYSIPTIDEPSRKKVKVTQATSILPDEPSRKKVKVTQATSILPDDLIRSILILLPARSVFRFRCVCKEWNEWLKDPNFLNLRSEPSLLNEIQDGSDLYYVTFPDLASGVCTEVARFYLGPCMNIPIERGYDVSYRCVEDLICYRCDSKHLTILDKQTLRYYLVPEIGLSSFDYEFGAGSLSNEYKIVIWSISSEFKFYVTTVSSIGRSTSRHITLSGSWRKPLGKLPLVETEIEMSVVTSAGYVYMFDGEKLLSFHFDSETFNQIVLPLKEVDSDDGLIHPEHSRKGFSFDGFNFFEYNIRNELFEYLGRICLVELATFAAVTALVTPLEGTTIEGIWLLNDEDNTWKKILEKKPLSLPTLPGSSIWSRKHSRFSSTKSGDQILITSFHEGLLHVTKYSLFHPSFPFSAIGSYSEDACCIEV